MATNDWDKVLIDTSVWIEFFRKNEPRHDVVLKLMEEGRICCTGIVIAELLEGAKSEKEVSVLRDFFHVFEFLTESPEIWREAGQLSFHLRRQGKTVGLADCLIAKVASFHKARIYTLDRHFGTITAEAGIRLYKGKPL